MPGTLFVVATPIGNLEDLTFRALRTLREVDLIAAEDTRRTAKLLAHYEIRKPMVSLREHNEHRESPRLVARLQAGENIALVSDAGTPGIADPGARLVRAARDAGLTPVPIPGPSAITAALSVAGFDGSTFVFMGFPPPKGTDRQLWLRQLALERRTVIAFEAPHRIERTLSDIKVNCVERPINLAREITKIHYELVEYLSKTAIKIGRTDGEFVIIVGPPVALGSDHPKGNADLKAANLYGYLTNNTETPVDDAKLISAYALGLTTDSVVAALRLTKKLAKQQRMAKA